MTNEESKNQFRRYTFSTFEFKVVLVLNITKLQPIVMDMVDFWSGSESLMRRCDGDSIEAFARMAALLGLRTCMEQQIEASSLKWALDGPYAPDEGWYSPLSDIVNYIDVEYEPIPDQESFEVDKVEDVSSMSGVVA